MLLKALVREGTGGPGHPEGRSNTVGACWINKDGSMSISLRPGVVLSWNDGLQLTAFPPFPQGRRTERPDPEIPETDDPGPDPWQGPEPVVADRLAPAKAQHPAHVAARIKHGDGVDENTR
jgi:hypothetical protein